MVWGNFRLMKRRWGDIRLMERVEVVLDLGMRTSKDKLKGVA